MKMRSLMLLAICSAAASSSMSRGSLTHPYTMTLTSPNLTITQSAFICTANVRPFPDSHIVKILPKPGKDQRLHISLILCDNPLDDELMATTDGQSIAWSCDLESPSPVLRNARECVVNNKSRHNFNYQFQGGSLEEGMLLLPPGYGIPVGEDSVFKTMVAEFHYFDAPDQPPIRSIAGSEMEVTLVPNSDKRDLRPVYSLLIAGYGFVGADSVGSVSASWRFEEETVMHLLSLYTHWHEKAIDVQVWIQRMSGETDVILRQDPHMFAGTMDISNKTSALLRPGDSLTIQCTFNNSASHNLRVQTDEMCELTAMYWTQDDRILTQAEVYSVDPGLKDCITELEDQFSWISVNYEGSSSFHDVTEDDCD